MASLRQTRETLLLAHLIADEEFVLLDYVSTFKYLDLMYWTCNPSGIGLESLYACREPKNVVQWSKKATYSNVSMHCI